MMDLFILVGLAAGAATLGLVGFAVVWDRSNVSKLPYMPSHLALIDQPNILEQYTGSVLDLVMMVVEAYNTAATTRKTLAFTIKKQDLAQQERRVDELRSKLVPLLDDDLTEPAKRWSDLRSALQKLAANPDLTQPAAWDTLPTVGRDLTPSFTVVPSDPIGLHKLPADQLQLLYQVVKDSRGMAKPPDVQQLTDWAQAWQHNNRLTKDLTWISERLEKIDHWQAELAEMRQRATSPGVWSEDDVRKRLRAMANTLAQAASKARMVRKRLTDQHKAIQTLGTMLQDNTPMDAYAAWIERMQLSLCEEDQGTSSA